MSSYDYDVIVVGAGVMGLSTAWQLSLRGQRVLLLEQFPFPHARGSSHGHSRIIRYAYKEAHYAAMMPTAHRMWLKLEEERRRQLIITTGLIHTGTGKFLDEIEQVLQEQKYPYQRLTPAETRTRFPDFPIHDDNDILFYSSPGAGILLADKCLLSLKEAAEDAGTTFLEMKKVTSVRPVDLRRVEVVLQDGQLFAASSVVLCAGSWAGEMLEQLGLHLPLTPLLVDVAYWKQKQATDKKRYSAENFPCFGARVGDDFFYGLPALEYPGLMKICVHDGPLVDPNCRDSSVTDPLALKNYIKKYWKQLEPEPVIHEKCIYTMTPDDNFILDRHPKFTNIVIGAGFSGTGFKMAPVVGVILAELATGSPSSFDISPFKINRFTKKAKL